MLLNELLSSLNLGRMPESPITGVSIDSRHVSPGHLFVAIKGPHFDGHAFIPEAINKGAVAVLCEYIVPHVTSPQWLVPNTIQSLGTIAAAYRKSLSDLRVIALTGSNGKTTVKEMIASCLPSPSFATKGNLNNHLGVPLSLLGLNNQHKSAVFELGANHAGDIAYTVGMVLPHVTLINNIAPAHIGEFGSIDGVARAKGEIHAGLLSGGTAVVNADDVYAHAWDALFEDKQVVRFSVKTPETIHASDIDLSSVEGPAFRLVTPEGDAMVQLQVPGIHNVSNALAACACLRALGVSHEAVATGLSLFTGVSGRMSYRLGKSDAVVIDDTYNANLRSVLAALEVLAARPGRRIFVFGDMGELGDFSHEHHEAVGRAAKTFGIDKLLACGEHSRATVVAFGEGARHYLTKEALVSHLMPCLDTSTTVLVKGSRSSAMEKIVHELIV